MLRHALVSFWQIAALIRARCKRISATAVFNRLCVIPSWRRTVSRTFGANRLAQQVNKPDRSSAHVHLALSNLHFDGVIFGSLSPMQPRGIRAPYSNARRFNLAIAPPPLLAIEPGADVPVKRLLRSLSWVRCQLSDRRCFICCFSDVVRRNYPQGSIGDIAAHLNLTLHPPE
jgi:hypothetical protein